MSDGGDSDGGKGKYIAQVVFDLPEFDADSFTDAENKLRASLTDLLNTVPGELMLVAPDGTVGQAMVMSKRSMN